MIPISPCQNRLHRLALSDSVTADAHCSRCGFEADSYLFPLSISSQIRFGLNSKSDVNLPNLVVNSCNITYVSYHDCRPVTQGKHSSECHSLGWLQTLLHTSRDMSTSYSSISRLAKIQNTVKKSFWDCILASRKHIYNIHGRHLDYATNCSLYVCSDVLKGTSEFSCTHDYRPGCTRNQPARLSTHHPFSLVLRHHFCAKSSEHAWHLLFLVHHAQSLLPGRLTKLVSDCGTWKYRKVVYNDTKVIYIQSSNHGIIMVPVGQAFPVSTIPNCYVNSPTRIKSPLVDSLLHEQWNHQMELSQPWTKRSEAKVLNNNIVQLRDLIRAIPHVHKHAHDLRLPYPHEQHRAKAPLQPSYCHLRLDEPNCYYTMVHATIRWAMASFSCQP